MTMLNLAWSFYNFNKDIYWKGCFKMKNERFKQRFNNFEKAYKLLKQACEKNPDELSDLEQEGVIQRFEYTYELVWKMLKDYLEYSGNVNLVEFTPRNVFKEAFASKIINDGQVFIDMMLSRNFLSRCYEREKALDILDDMQCKYLPALDNLYESFSIKIKEMD